MGMVISLWKDEKGVGSPATQLGCVPFQKRHNAACRPDAAWIHRLFRCLYFELENPALRVGL